MRDDQRQNISAAPELTPWLLQLYAELDGCLADLAQTMSAIQDGTYAERATGQRFGLVEVDFPPDSSYLSSKALQRASETCFRAAIASFINFLDKLIATALLRKEGIRIERDLSAYEEIQRYLNAYLTRKISQVASDRALTNPKKLDYFPSLSEFSRRAALSYFTLRRSLEHHQGMPQEDIEIHVYRQKLFIDDVEATELPAVCHGGQVVQLRLVTDRKMLPMGTRVILSPEDAHAIVFTIRVAMAPEVFKVHIESFQDANAAPPTAG
jgi:hypothetical protein